MCVSNINNIEQLIFLEDTMKVILFPAQKKFKDDLHLHGFEYTCDACNTKIRFTQTNMLFKIMEFFCLSCGNKHKISNPEFFKK